MYDAGLVLEGGGMRGLFTAGVLDCFMDHDIYFKNLYGVSAGACQGANYASHQRGRSLEVNTTYLKDKRYAGIFNLVKTGDYFEKDFQMNVIPNELNPYDYEAYKNSGINFYVVVTNCRTGKAEYLKIDDMANESDKLWASSTLPLLSRIVEIDGEQYMDGCVADSIPVNRAIKDGNHRVVVVLTRDINYKKKKDELIPAIKVKYKNFPNLVEACENRHKLYNKTLAYIRKLESDGKIIVIRPERPVELGKLERNEEKLRALYDEGYAVAEKNIDKMKEYLKM